MEQRWVPRVFATLRRLDDMEQRLVSRVALRGGRTLGMDAGGRWLGESLKRVSRGRQPIDAVKQAPVVIQ